MRPKPVREGRWAEDEHGRFLEALARFGTRNWGPIIKYVATRNGAQVRSHAQKYLYRRQRDALELERAAFLARGLESSSEPA
jgi:SHAQKYF class myb-like DNA-binding protein